MNGAAGPPETPGADAAIGVSVQMLPAPAGGFLVVLSVSAGRLASNLVLEGADAVRLGELLVDKGRQAASGLIVPDPVIPRDAPRNGDRMRPVREPPAW